MNMCQPVTSNLHQRHLCSAVRGGLIVPPTKTVRYGPCSFAVAGPSRWNAHYLHHYATTNSLPCHFVASWKLNYTLEHVIHTSTLVIVFTVRVDEHNFIVLTYLLTYIRGPWATWTPPIRKIIVPEMSTLPHLIVFNFNFLTPVDSEIIWGSQICIKVPCAPRICPSGKILTHPIPPSTCLYLYNCKVSAS